MLAPRPKVVLGLLLYVSLSCAWHASVFACMCVYALSGGPSGSEPRPSSDFICVCLSSQGEPPRDHGPPHYRSYSQHLQRYGDMPVERAPPKGLVLL